MVCTGIICGDTTGKQISNGLDGALSTQQDFFYINTFRNNILGSGYKNKGFLSHMPIASFISEDVIVDEENDMFITDNGVIVDAYDFKGIKDSDKEKLSNLIIMQQQIKYPDYEFKVLPGSFPIEVRGGLTVNDKVVSNPETIMSSHILYITDYKKHLKNKNIQKVKA